VRAIPCVLILAGGLSHEREISLRSGRRVARALIDSGCHVEVRDVDAGLWDSLGSMRPDVVWPLLHGSSGEDGAIRDVLELGGFRYLGSGPEACRLAWDKSVAKSVARGAGLRVPDAVALPHGVFRELGAQTVLTALVHRFGLPLVIKPARGGSALGVTVVQRIGELSKAMVTCFAYGEVAVVERWIDGVEVAVSVVDTGSGPVALPSVEIVADNGIYGYDARYTAGVTQFFCPARLTRECGAEVAAAGVTIHRAFGLRHLSRSDLIVDREGLVWFLEVNVAPGMTETSLFPQSVEASDRDTGPLYRRLVETAVKGTG
jgi:D-alanine-D-alanine ligase